MLRPTAAALLGALVLCTLPSPRTAQAAPVEAEPAMDQEFACLQLVPEEMSFENRPHVLRLRILLDGTTKKQAKAAVAAMRTAYDPLNVEVVPSYAKATFEGTDANDLIEQSKKVYGGKRPKGVDVVYTLTNKDIAAEGSPAGRNVAGLADCIGGIRFADRAFAVGEVDRPKDSPPTILPFPVTDVAGKTMAHEVGHLLGAHHHFASVEGANGREVATLMGPTLSIIGLRFSTLEGAAVRGHLEFHEKHAGK
ncbi:MAG: zinc-dependent metalloprotease family protein [Sporichthyaceae bacterium]